MVKMYIVYTVLFFMYFEPKNNKTIATNNIEPS